MNDTGCCSEQTKNTKTPLTLSLVVIFSRCTIRADQNLLQKYLRMDILELKKGAPPERMTNNKPGKKERTKTKKSEKSPLLKESKKSS